MIRPLTCICMLLAGGSGLYLYQSKHRAQMLDREIEQTLKAADAARDRIGVLRGEWALLNEPERLAALSQAHLKLKSLAPWQFVTAAELGAFLPPPLVPGTADSPGEEEPPLPPVQVADAAKPSGLRELPQPPAPALPPVAPLGALLLRNLPTPAHPVVVTAKTPPPRPVLAHPVFAPVVDVSTSPIVTAAALRPAPARLAPSASASAAPPAASTRSSAPATSGLSIGESVARAARLQDGAQPAGATGPTLPAYNPPAHGQASSSQASPSALGGVRPLLPPPVPVGSATAASVASAR